MALTAALLGSVIGLIMAWTGAGGGLLAVPMLVLVLHLPLQEAAPLGLLAVGASAWVGALMGLRQGIVRYKAAALIGGLGMLAAPWGVSLAARLPTQWLTLGFGLLMVGLALRAWLRPADDATERPDAEAPPCVANPQHGRLVWTSPCVRALGLTGLVSGLLSGLVGVGGGFVIVPALRRHSDLTLPSIQATSLAVIALVSSSAVTGALLHGQVRNDLAPWFAGAAVVALLAGRQVAAHLPTAWLQRAFQAVTLLAGFVMVAKGGGWLP
jgi:uncharacterized membrane protein YfcA